MTTAVGIIAHTASGKDIRRLVAQAPTISDQAKIDTIAQALVGLGALGIARALLMPDQQQFGRRAARQARQENPACPLPAVEVLDLPVAGKAADTIHAAERMRACGVGSIIVLGGDGTARAASLGAGETPLLAVSTGTNNVLPHCIDGTIAGMAAGVVAQGLVTRDKAGYRGKRLSMALDGQPLDVALVDVALLAGRFTGARAVWQGDALRHLWVTRAEAHNVGLTTIAARLGLIGPRDPWGRWVELSEISSLRALAVLAPGLVREVGISAGHELWKDRPATVKVTEASVLALDGEREHAIRAGADLQVTLRLDGPWLIDPQATMRAWAEVNLLQFNDRGIG